MVRIWQPTLRRSVKRGDELVAFLAKPDHESGLRRYVGRVTPRPIQQLERARIPSARPCHAVQARDGFGVVIQHVGTRIEHGSERRLVPPEIGNQHLEPALGQPRARFADRVGEDRGASVRQIVAVDRRDDDVAQAERVDGVGDADRFVGIGGLGTSVRHRAIGARAGAHLAENHERGGAVMPALADVRALRFLAHGVEVELAHEALEPGEVGRPGRAHLEPLGLGRPRRGHERDEVAHRLN